MTTEVPQAVSTEELEPGLEKATAIVSERLVLQHRGVEWEVPPEVLRGMLRVRDGVGRSKPDVTIDSGALTTYLGSLADTVRREGRNARPVWNGTQFIVRRSVSSETLDAGATSAAVIRALEAGKHRVDIAVRQEPMPIGDVDALDAAQRAQTFVAQPFQVTWPDGSAEISPADLVTAIRFTEQPEANPKIAVDIDSEYPWDRT